MKTTKDYNVLQSNQKWFKDNNLDLDDALGEISVMEAEEYQYCQEEDRDVILVETDFGLRLCEV